LVSKLQIELASGGGGGATLVARLYDDDADGRLLDEKTYALNVHESLVFEADEGLPDSFAEARPI
jgi:hypothetical protein